MLNSLALEMKVGDVVVMMRPEYYSDLFRRYSVYCRNYDGTNYTRLLPARGDYDYNGPKC